MARGAAQPAATGSEPEPLPAASSDEPLTLEPPTLPGPPPPAQPTLAPPGPALGLLGAAGDVRPLADIEAEVIRFAIAHYRGQMSEVARRLQIGRSTLYRKLDDLGFEDARPDETAPDTVAAG
jgi:DNA-binding NtrC family response regulator